MWGGQLGMKSWSSGRCRSVLCILIPNFISRGVLRAKKVRGKREKKWGGHGILCLPRLKKWGDKSPVSPTKLRPWMCVVQRYLKSFSLHWAVEGMAQDCYKTIEVKEYPTLTRAVLQTVNILLHWISSALATVQASLVFTRYLIHKKQPEGDLGWIKVRHWPRVIWNMDSGVLFHALYATITNT